MKRLTQKNDRLDIDRIAFLGRTYDEYLDLFGLNEAVLGSGRLLDCPGGASSFALEAAQKGYGVTACDILYDNSATDLFEKGKKDITHVFEKFDEVSHLYTWDYYRSKQEVMELRSKALELFVEDFSGCSAEGRYIPARLPHLPFPDGMFSVVLSGHFLFLYGDRLNIDFHKACLVELMRVCSGEVRIFPLVGLDTKPYYRLDEILQFLAEKDIRADIVRVPLEFQRGADHMIMLTRNVISQEVIHGN
jgi:hypothetical protein